ncbi:MAG: hypothetical protein J0M12_08365 [Deltaproteobacteria bacterium]|nr:hypothetical protein [Deltaproteobacteria bacterium]
MSERREAGMVTLEAGVTTIMLCLLLLGGFGVTDYLDRLDFINGVIERELGDSAIKPFRLEGGSTGRATMQVNTVALHEYLDGVLASVEQSLQVHRYTKYFIEVGAAKAQLDPLTGKFLGFDPAAEFRESRGTLQVSSTLASFSDLPARFDQLAGTTQSHASLPAVSLVAAPLSLFGMAEGVQFNEASILVGLRVFASLEGSLSGTAYQQIGISPLIEGYKVVQLRGVLE